MSSDRQKRIEELKEVAKTYLRFSYVEGIKGADNPVDCFYEQKRNREVMDVTVPKWDFLCIAPGKIMPSKPVTCKPKHESPANESESKTWTPSPIIYDSGIFLKLY